MSVGPAGQPAHGNERLSLGMSMKQAFIRCLCISFFCLAFSECRDSGNSNGRKDPAPKGSAVATKSILFFGDSLTAGYGLEEPSLAFPGLIQKKLDSAGLPYRVVNGGVSGETTSGGVERIDWILSQPVDVFVLELGANDGLRGIPVETTRKNLQIIIDRVKDKYPGAKIILAGMQVPPNMGPQYADAFRAIFPDIARKNKAELIPFLLEHVGGEASLNQDDGIHPNAEGHRMVADNVWPVLSRVLGS